MVILLACLISIIVVILIFAYPRLGVFLLIFFSVFQLDYFYRWHIISFPRFWAWLPFLFAIVLLPLLLVEQISGQKGIPIFLSPSVSASNGDTEGGAPVSIIEVSASGMPVLSTEHCDIPEVVLDGKSGYLVPERDIDGLAERLGHLVLNPGIWEEMGLKGRKHIENQYDVKKQVQILEEIYTKVISAQ